jgi:predicted dienelactone hydrolase
VVNSLACCILAIPKLRSSNWVAYILPAAVLVAAVQILAEGPRWQMVPAYALAVIFFLVWLERVLMPGVPPANRVIASVGVALVGLALVVSIALPIVLPVFHFPRATGSYQIGTVTYHWVDTTRHELFRTDPSAHRELMVQIWYPARANSSAVHAPYVQDAAALSPALARVLHLPGFALDHFKYVTTAATPSAPMATDRSTYPVLILLEGINGFRQVNTFQVQELVSHGYVVAALDQPYAAALVAFPDGRLDMQHVGVFGVSLGAMVAAEVAHRDPRIKASLMMDAAMPADVVKAGLQQPSMWLTRDAGTMRLERQRSGGWSEQDIAQTLSTMRAVFNKSRPGEGYYVQIPGMFHINFTDAPYWSPLEAPLGLVGPIDAQRGFDIVNAYSLAFFDRHLKGSAPPLLEASPKKYPQVLFESR